MSSSEANQARLEVVIAVILKDDKVLICQRLNKGHLPGVWEFPGGKREANESAEQCLHREMQEELAITVEPLRQLPPIEHTYPTMSVRLIPFICQHKNGDPQPLACQQTRWVLATELRNFTFPAANAGLVEEVIALLSPPLGS